MTDPDAERVAIQTRIGWLALAKLITATAPPPPRSTAEAIYPHLAEATLKENPR
jgi:hypothetical protein